MGTGMFFVLVIFVVIAIVVAMGGIFYLLAKRYFENRQKEQLLQMKIDERRETLKVVTPIRLQAYERVALFLERISPNSLVLRCYQPGMDLKLLQGVMTKVIRDEWEHNLSQQVYLSSKAWAMIREAKEQMIGVINSAAITVPADADPARLASTIFATVAEGQLPTTPALEYLKQEFREL